MARTSTRLIIRAPHHCIPEALDSYWNHIGGLGRTADRSVARSEASCRKMKIRAALGVQNAAGCSTVDVEVNSELIQLFSPIFKIRKNTEGRPESASLLTPR